MIPIYRLPDDIEARRAFWTYAYAEGLNWVEIKKLTEVHTYVHQYTQYQYVLWYKNHLRYAANMDEVELYTTNSLLTNSPRHLVRAIRALKP
jgi:hypothetical protein